MPTNPKPFNSQDDWQRQQPGLTLWTTKGEPINFHSLPESTQYFLYKTAEGSPGNVPGTGLFGRENGGGGLGINLSAGATGQNISQASGREEFTHGGLSYYKENGNTYMTHPELPGGVHEVHPDAAAEIDRQREEEKARLEKEKAWREEQEKNDAAKWRQPTEAEARQIFERDGVIAGTAADILSGAAGAATGGILAPALTGYLSNKALTSVYDATKEAQIRKFMETGKVPDFGNVDPEMVADYFGRGS